MFGTGLMASNGCPYIGLPGQCCNCLLYQFQGVVAYPWQQASAFAQHLDGEACLYNQGQDLCFYDRLKFFEDQHDIEFLEEFA